MNCLICGGVGVELGVLGMLKHFTCRQCGVQFSKKMKPRRKRCADCGKLGARVGHQDCQYPGRVSEGRM